MSIATRGKWSGRTSGTLIFCVALATVVAVAQKAAGSGADEADELWRFEGPNIAKVAQFTAKQQATVLFTVDGLVGYATAGTARRLDLPRGGSGCANLNPALSHDGRLVAFITGGEAGNCRIAIFEIASGKVRPLIDLKSDPGQLPWSWDDSEIAFFHCSLSDPSVQAVSIRDGSVRTIAPFNQLAAHGLPFGYLVRFDASAPVQWMHSGSGLLVGIIGDVPTRQPNACDVEFSIELAKNGVLTKFSDGYDAVVSPIADRIAWYAGSKIVVANVDGTDRRVLSGSPRWMGIMPEDLGGSLTWSPDGKQLFFGVVVSENCSDDVYLLQVDNGRYKRFLHHSCIAILDWR